MKRKEKKCIVCKKLFQPFKTTQRTCSVQCAIDYAKSKEEKRQAKEWLERKKVLKLKTTDWKKSLQTEINKIARLIDLGLPCLATNYPANQMHGGHVYSRGGHSNMRFHLANIHRQAANSNHWQNDDAKLRDGLINEYGQDYFDWLTSLKSMPQVKYTNEDYNTLTTKARAIVRRLEKMNNSVNLPRSVKERIELRSQINEELSIYPEQYQKFNH